MVLLPSKLPGSVLVTKIDRRDGMQLQCCKVSNVEEEVNRHFSNAHEGKGFKGGLMYDIQEGVFQFSAKSIPIPGIGDDDGYRETF